MTDPRPDSGSRRAVLVRVIKWAMMLVTVLWFLLYRAAQESSGVPEFLYVNF